LNTRAFFEDRFGGLGAARTWLEIAGQRVGQVDLTAVSEGSRIKAFGSHSSRAIHIQTNRFGRTGAPSTNIIFGDNHVLPSRVLGHEGQRLSLSPGRVPLHGRVAISHRWSP